MGDFDHFTFPATPEDAESRFKLFEHSDPFAKEIPPALLNSRDISEYVRVAGIVHPFDGRNGKLKSASYEIGFTGTVCYWKDGDKEDFKREPIIPDEPFTIPKNSIVFVSPETTFRLPDYIALRFNLRIKHVHRGLILGTGPLVDPGFAGQLFIPLHNLTSEPYTLIGGEGLVWVEFTKVSPHPHWVNKEVAHDGYEHFQESSRHLTPQQYMNKASNGKPARSSIPLEVDQAKQESSTALQEVRNFESRIKKWSFWGAIGSVIALIIPICALGWSVYGLVSDANKYVRESKESAESSIGTYKKTLDEQQAAITALQKQVAKLETEGQRTVSVTEKPERSKREYPSK